MKSIHGRLYGTYGKIEVEGIIQQLIPEEVMRHRNVIEFLHSEGYIRFKADSEASSKALYLSSELSQNERLYNFTMWKPPTTSMETVKLFNQHTMIKSSI